MHKRIIIRIMSWMLCGVLFAAMTPALAQWSIGKPGDRLPPAGLNRYAYFIMANPVPGREAAFNEWYNQYHFGDLGQLDGWVGAQRFRLVPDVHPPVSTLEAVHFGYSVIWELEGKDFDSVHAAAPQSLAGGKSRRGINAYNYNPGGSAGFTYQVAAARVSRPDGRKAFMPAFSDVHTPRPDRYVLMEFTDPAPGVSDAAYEAALDKTIPQVLGVNGWMGAQRFRLLAAARPANGRPSPPPRPRDLVIWEVEGSAQAAQDARIAAEKSGAVTPAQFDRATIQAAWWAPISPYITKPDFER